MFRKIIKDEDDQLLLSDDSPETLSIESSESGEQQTQPPNLPQSSSSTSRQLTTSQPLEESQSTMQAHVPSIELQASPIALATSTQSSSSRRSSCPPTPEPSPGTSLTAEPKSRLKKSPEPGTLSKLKERLHLSSRRSSFSSPSTRPTSSEPSTSSKMNLSPKSVSQAVSKVMEAVFHPKRSSKRSLTHETGDTVPHHQPKKEKTRRTQASKSQKVVKGKVPPFSTPKKPPKRSATDYLIAKGDSDYYSSKEGTEITDVSMTSLEDNAGTSAGSQGALFTTQRSESASMEDLRRLTGPSISGTTFTGSLLAISPQETRHGLARPSTSGTIFSPIPWDSLPEKRMRTSTESLSTSFSTFRPGNITPDETTRSSIGSDRDTSFVQLSDIPHDEDTRSSIGSISTAATSFVANLQLLANEESDSHSSASGGGSKDDKPSSKKMGSKDGEPSKKMGSKDGEPSKKVRE